MVHGCAPLLLALPGRAQAPAVSPWLPGAGRTGRWSRLAGSHGAPSSPRCAGAVRPAPAVPCCRELLYGAVLPPCPVQPRSPSCWWRGAVGIAAAAPARQLLVGEPQGAPCLHPAAPAPPLAPVQEKSPGRLLGAGREGQRLLAASCPAWPPVARAPAPAGHASQQCHGPAAPGHPQARAQRGFNCTAAASLFPHLV